jgi:hypothetical protein
MKFAKLSSLLTLGLATLLAGCKVGPNYVRPQASAPPAYQEAPPDATQAGNWKIATPAHPALAGDW